MTIDVRGKVYTRKNMNTTHFYDQYPECKPKNFVDLGYIQSSSNEVVRRRRLGQRYSLCDLGTPTNSLGEPNPNPDDEFYTGEHTISANCYPEGCAAQGGVQGLCNT